MISTGYQLYQPDISYINRISVISTGYQLYQPDIRALCTPDVMSCYPLERLFLIKMPTEMNSVESSCDPALL